ncbi:UDP-glucose dehydrogenase family protein [Macrococcus capreoli]|uniref:UDP-glucose dehydrogenase family protein n=1 Tax=Macrococcus capreoli TaxID=2982690 RepID=UPI003EE6E0EB
MKEVLVIGAGYVGLITGVSLAEIGNSVTCLDVDSHKIETLKKGKTPIYEPGLDDYLTKNINEGRLNFTTDYKAAVEKSEIIYIAVGTPENEEGAANLEYLFNVVEELKKYINNEKIVVVKSTVPIGTNRKVQDELSQLPYNINVVSNPEFLREGTAFYDAFNGDRIVIGGYDENSISVIEDINKPFGIEIFKTTTESAEMIKYASNAFLATKISFVNEIANICELVGADIQDVSKGMGMDTRIGNKFLNAGIGYGGSCFPKDTKALSYLSKQLNFDPLIIESIIERNNRQKLSLVDKYNNFSEMKDEAIGLLGLSFKPNTDDLREAASLSIIEKLNEMGKEIYAYDPISGGIAQEKLGDKIKVLKSSDELLEKVSVVFIVTEWDEFKNLEFSKNKKYEIYDGRNILETDSIPVNSKYYRIGR